MEIITQLQPILLILLGALLASLGGFVQKRFDLKLDQKNNDKVLLSEIIILLPYLLKTKIEQQSGASTENFLVINRQIMKLNFQLRSKCHRFIKKEITIFMSKPIEKFEFEKLEALGNNIQDILEED